MKKCLILTASLLLSIAAQAETCKSMTLTLIPSADTKAACEALGFQGAGTMKTCLKSPADFPPRSSEYTLDTGGVYELTANLNSWVSKSVFLDDESGTMITTILTINTHPASYYAKQITTDRRGHRSDIDCSGSFDIN